MILFHMFSSEFAFLNQCFYEIRPLLSLKPKVFHFHRSISFYDNTTTYLPTLLLMETIFGCLLLQVLFCAFVCTILVYLRVSRIYFYECY